MKKFLKTKINIYNKLKSNRHPLLITKSLLSNKFLTITYHVYISLKSINYYNTNCFFKLKLICLSSYRVRSVYKNYNLSRLELKSLLESKLIDSFNKY